MALRPPVSETWARRRPSGDTLGSRSYWGPRVSRSTSPDDRSTAQMSYVPSRNDWKATRRPSEKNDGQVASSTSSVSRRAGPPATGISHRLFTASNTMRPVPP